MATRYRCTIESCVGSVLWSRANLLSKCAIHLVWIDLRQHDCDYASGNYHNVKIRLLSMPRRKKEAAGLGGSQRQMWDDEARCAQETGALRGGGHARSL